METVVNVLTGEVKQFLTAAHADQFEKENSKHADTKHPVRCWFYFRPKEDVYVGLEDRLYFAKVEYLKNVKYWDDREHSFH